MSAADLAASRTRKTWFAALFAGIGVLGFASAASADDANRIASYALATAESEGAGVTELTVEGSTAPSYAMRVVGGGKRIELDVRNAFGDTLPMNVEAKGIVGGVLSQSFKTDAGQLTRFTITLKDNAWYRVRVRGNSLVLKLTPAKETGPDPRPDTASSPSSAAGGEQSSVKTLRVDRKKDCMTGCERILVQLDRVPTYSVRSEGNRLALTLKKTKLAGTAKDPIELAGGTLRRVIGTYDESADESTIVIDRTGDSQGAVSVDGNTLVWSFDPPRDVGKGVSRRTVTVSREATGENMPKIETSVHDSDMKVEETATGTAAGFFNQSTHAQVAATTKYNGRRIDLDFKDIDVHDVLRLIADVGKFNVITSDDVSGKITIRMRNVPWDQALDYVLQTKALGMVRAGNLIRVAPLDKLQKEREQRLAAMKQEYELLPLETRLIPVSYATADEMAARSKELLSPRGSITVDERTNVLIARDIAGNLNNVEELVRQLDTQTPQVLIEARIVEATSRYQRDFGIQWGGDGSFSAATGNPTGVAFPSTITAAGGAYDGQAPTQGISPTSQTIPVPNFAVNLPAAVGTGRGGAIGFSLGSIDSNFNVNLRLSAAEASGLLRIVSSPRVLTLDNRDARINQGTLIPFSQVSAQGVQTTFQEAKLQLLVKPHVTADGAVSMHVKINRDEPDFNQTSARGDPTILKREAETDLLVMDGHTAVIGGIYTRNTGRNVDQVPFFGDIPILGILFQRRRASDTRNELVIFITPRIVNRAEALGR